MGKRVVSVVVRRLLSYDIARLPYVGAEWCKRKCGMCPALAFEDSFAFTWPPLTCFHAMATPHEEHCQ